MIMSNNISRVKKIENGWIIELKDNEVENIKKAHFRVEGLFAIANASNGLPTDEVVIRLGEASSELKDLGMNIAATEITELTETDIPFNWKCDFEAKTLIITLV